MVKQQAHYVEGPVGRVALFSRIDFFAAGGGVWNIGYMVSPVMPVSPVSRAPEQ
jgi:hypothetical protein